MPSAFPSSALSQNVDLPPQPTPPSPHPFTPPRWNMTLLGGQGVQLAGCEYDHASGLQLKTNRRLTKHGQRAKVQTSTMGYMGVETRLAVSVLKKILSLMSRGLAFDCQS